MTTGTDRSATKTSSDRLFAASATPRRAAQPSAELPGEGRRISSGLRSVGTGTVAATAAVILGVGGYLAHSALAPLPASPAPVAVSRALPAPAVDAAGVRPVQVTVVAGQQSRPNTPTATRTDTSRVLASDHRTVASTSTARTLVWKSQRTVDVRQPVMTSTTVTHIHQAAARDRVTATQPGYQIVATDGSIVYVGDEGRLVANTGATSSSGVVALDVDGSSLGSGNSRSSSPTAADATANQSIAQMTRGGSSVAVSGFEDHSVSVVGDNQLVSYDDSNVFVNRNGKINANTGDTDSSGLNAVDVTDSRVRSGNSGDGEGADENEDEAAEPSPADPGAATDVAGDDDSGSDEADSTGGQPEADTKAGSTRKAVVTDEGASMAEGDHPVVVGADGFDDVSIRSHGNGNVVTYDDSNVVIGGTGDVNAQIGDSDTGGTVVMGIHNSDVTAGCEGDLC